MVLFPALSCAESTGKRGKNPDGTCETRRQALKATRYGISASTPHGFLSLRYCSSTSEILEGSERTDIKDAHGPGAHEEKKVNDAGKWHASKSVAKWALSKHPRQTLDQRFPAFLCRPVCVRCAKTPHGEKRDSLSQSRPMKPCCTSRQEQRSGGEQPNSP